MNKYENEKNMYESVSSRTIKNLSDEADELKRKAEKWNDLDHQEAEMERGIVLLEAEMFRLQNSIIFKDTQIGDLEETRREMEANCEEHAEKNKHLAH